VAEIRQTKLPGVGVCNDFELSSGVRVGVVLRSSGRREFVVYETADPDAVGFRLDLSADESVTLAELLDDQRVTANVGDIDGLIEGLALDWLPLPDDFSTAAIGDLQIRTRTGATIVAVVRDHDPVPAPGPEYVLHPGDTAVVVGTPDGIRATTELLGA
jgi:K+:H+ antiporter subunit KhtT